MWWTWSCGDSAQKWTTRSRRSSSTRFAESAMYSKPAEPRSISSQLVLLFTTASILLLSCGLGVFYWLVVRHAFEEDNAVLADKVLALVGDLKNIDGPKIIDAEVHARRAGEHGIYWIRLLDPH